MNKQDVIKKLIEIKAYLDSTSNAMSLIGDSRSGNKVLELFNGEGPYVTIGYSEEKSLFYTSVVSRGGKEVPFYRNFTNKIVEKFQLKTA